MLWGPALAVELIAPLVWYWVPGRGKIPEIGQSIEGSHFAERCQGFVIIALGESIVVTGASAAHARLTAPVVGALAIAFVQTAALWWLYFSEAAVHSRRQMATSDDVVDLARDAYTYLHLPIVAGIILSAVGADYLTSDPGGTLNGAQAAITLAGPIVYLTGELLFRRRMIHTGNPKRYAAIVALVALGLARHVGQRRRARAADRRRSWSRWRCGSTRPSRRSPAMPEAARPAAGTGHRGGPGGRDRRGDRRPAARGRV